MTRSSSIGSGGDPRARMRELIARLRRRAIGLAWSPLDVYLHFYRSYFPSVGASFYDDGMQLVVRYRTSAVQRMERLIALAIALLVIGGALAWAAPISFTMDCTIDNGNTATQQSLQSQLDAKVQEAQTQLAALQAQAQALAGTADQAALDAANQKLADASAALSSAVAAVATAGNRVGSGQDYFRAAGNYGDACTSLAAAIALINEAEVLVNQAAQTVPIVPVASIVGSASTTEGNSGTTTLDLAVTLSQATTVPVSVDFASADGSATTANDDYEVASGTLNFAAGDTTENVTVTINGDPTVEPNETFTVTLSNPTGASLGTSVATVTITNDDAVVPVVSIEASKATDEGNAGTKTVTLDVTLSQATTVPVSVAFATANGTATAGTDYVGNNGTLNFAEGDTTENVTVTINGDTTVEPNETFTVTLSNPTGATLGTSVATVTITNDDLPGISISGVSEAEGNSGTKFVNATVTLSEAMPGTVTVDFATGDGTAVAPDDYATTTGTLTFTSGELSKTIPIAIVGDTTVEPNESLTVTLSNPTGAALGTSVATVTITNDDVVVPVASIVGTASTTEGNSGTKTLDLAVTLSQATTVPVSIGFATADGTATAGTDYVGNNGTLNFAAGDTSETITLTINGDTIVEPNETFTVTLSNPTGATLGTSVATVTITNDDVVDITIADASIAEGDTGTSFVNVVVSLSQPSVGAVSVAFATSNGTAETPSDYASTSGTLTFNAGETTKTIPVAIAGDTIDENDETLRVDLSNAVNGNITDDRAIVTITDDDDPLEPDVTIADASVTEGNVGTTSVAVLVTLSEATSGAVSVQYETAVGTAGQTDFVADSGTLVFQVGNTSRTITVAVIGDLIDEPNETFTINLTSAANANITDAQATVTIIDDDLEPTPTPTPTPPAPTPTPTPSESATPTPTPDASPTPSEPAPTSTPTAPGPPSPAPSLPTSPVTPPDPSDPPNPSTPPSPPDIPPTPPVESPVPSFNPPPEPPLPSGAPVPPGTGDDDPLDELINAAPGDDNRGPRREGGNRPSPEATEPVSGGDIDAGLGGNGRPENLAELLIETAQAMAFPLLLVILIILFLLVQSRIDRNDPKLAHAPTHNDFLEFV